MISARIILTGMGKKSATGKKPATTLPAGKPSSLIDTRVIYCGDCLEQLRNLPDACVDLQGPYGTHELLSKYAAYAQELGRLPTANDLRLRDRVDPTFPNQKVFDRLGTKHQLVQRVIEYSRQRGGLADVIAMCEAYVPRPQARADDDAAPGLEIGYVYLIKHGSRREYKIGRTINALRREGEIGIELPERVQPVHVIKTDDPAGIEAYWHKRFDAKRKNGEWFELNATDVAAFKRRKFM